MMKELKTKDRKLVAIQDPHLHISEDYHIFNMVLVMEEVKESSERVIDENNHKGVYVVRQPSNVLKPFSGHCWPGPSIWLDYLQHKVRAFWSALYYYHYDEGFGEDVYAWNDMNEPSVFNAAETTFPRGVM